MRKLYIKEWRTLLFCFGMVLFGAGFYLISRGSVELFFFGLSAYTFVLTIAFLWLLTSTLFRK